MSTINLLLIDDHAMFRTGLVMVLRDAMADVRVLEMSSVEEVPDALDVPDVVLLDIKLQGLNGLDGIAPLKLKWPKVPIIMLSSVDTTESVQIALDRGAAAFVSKADTADNIIEVIKQALCTQVNVPSGKDAAGRCDKSLTPRQREVLDLMSRGMTNKTIGERLGLKENTVRWHVQDVLRYFDVSNRSEAAFAARSRGLID